MMGVFFKRPFHEKLMRVLQEQGNDGWELKGILYELGFHAHLVFARQASDGSNALDDKGFCELVER
jgi:hypothetical protein